jgi:hypothetical protein
VSVNKKIAELEVKLKKIEQLARQLGKNIDTVNLEPIQKNADTINALFDSLNDQVNDANAGVGYLVSQFSELVNQVKNTQSGINQSSKALRGLSSIAQEVENYQRGISDLSSKQIQKLQQQAKERRAELQTSQTTLKIERDNLKNNKQLLSNEKAILDEKLRVSSLTDAEFKKRKQLSQEINKAGKLLNQNALAQSGIDDMLNGTNASLDMLNDSLDGAENRAKAIEENMGLGGAAVDSLGQALQKAGFGSFAEKLGLDEAKDKMKALATEIADGAAEEQRLIEEIAQARQNQIDAANQITQSERDIAGIEQQINDLNKDNLSLAELENGEGGKRLENLVKQKKAQEDINKSARKRLNNAQGTEKSAKIQLDAQVASNKELTKGGSKFAVMKKGLKSMGASFKKNLTDPTALMSMLFTQLILAFKKADSATGDLAQNMNITYSQASKVRQELGAMADASGDPALNAQRLGESLTFINQSLGTNGQISEENLATFTKLREQAGMTNEQIMSMQKFTMATGGDLKGNVQKFQAAAKIMSYQKGIAINTKQLMADMGKLSNATKLSIKGGAEELAKQMVRAKSVGLELEKMNAIADKMLDFESSIEAELEAQLLTGANVNFEKARQLSLDNDLAGAAEEIAAQVEKAGDFNEMNRIQQEAMAKAAGMTRDELADMLMEQEALKSIGRDLNDQEREAYEAYKKKHGAAAAAKMLEEGQLENMTDQLSIQKRMAQAVEKLQGVFVRIMDVLMPIFDILMSVVDIVLPLINMALAPIIKGFQFVAAVVTGIGDAIGFVIGGLLKMKPVLVALGIALLPLMANAAIAAVGMIMSAFSFIPIIGPILGAAFITGALASIYSGVKSMVADDMFSPGEGSSGYGKRTLFGPEGAIQLNNKDTVIAGTNLFGDDTMSEPGKSTQTEKPGAFSFSSRDPKPTQPKEINKTDSLLSNLISEQRESNRLVRAGQNVNYDSFGTAASTSVFNISPG